MGEEAIMMRHVYWTCSRCGKRFDNPNEAEGHPRDHIVEDAIQGFRTDLDNIFGGPKVKSIKASIIRSGE